MAQDKKRIYQFKITLEGIKPLIWRRIQVSEDYTFWDLHVAIQDAMGWYDSHLHEFEIKNPEDRSAIRIGIPDEEGDEGRLTDWETPIAHYFSLENKKAVYEYDFGDGWEHKVVLEKILPANSNQNYPRCIEGERACPPEDCGGADGYQNLIEIMSDPQHEEYESMSEWLGKDLEPEIFEVEAVRFDNPKARLKEIFSQVIK